MESMEIKKAGSRKWEVVDGDKVIGTFKTRRAAKAKLEELQAGSADTGKETSGKDKGKDKTDKKEKKPGIIATIVQALEEAGGTGITKDEALDRLKKDFPDRDPEKMKMTVRVQLPTRIRKERFPVEKLEGGRYRKATS